jgi:hypothetical protein
VPARSSTPLNLKVLPSLAQKFPARAAGYGLTPSGLLSLLVWNDGLHPNPALAALAQDAKLVRQSLSCSLRTTQMAIARRRARAQSLSLNAYLEALIAALLARRPGPLTVFSR